MELTPGTALIADLEKEMLEKVRAIHVNSGALASICAADYGLPHDSFTRIPYGIDTQLFRPTPSRQRARLGLEDARILLFVGRMEQLKGISALVRAFAEVARALPDVVLLLVGPTSSGPRPTRATSGGCASSGKRSGCRATGTCFSAGFLTSRCQPSTLRQT